MTSSYGGVLGQKVTPQNFRLGQVSANPGSASKTTELFSKIKTYITGIHPTSVHLTGGCLMGVYLTGVHLTGVHLMGIHFMGMHLIGV